MQMGTPTKTIERLRERALALANERGLAEDVVEVVSARPLTADEAIGRPDRTDFPILKGKEFMIEARFRNSRGQAFTSMPGLFEGTVKEILTRDLETDFDHALVVATTNALASHLSLAERTVHCRDDGPRRCAEEAADYVGRRFGTPKIAFIGFQPAMISALAGRFPLRVTDLDPDNVGTSRLGVLVEDVENTREVVDWADIVFATGTVLANDTIDEILSTKPMVFYGVTIAGAAVLLDLDRYCPYGT